MTLKEKQKGSAKGKEAKVVRDTGIDRPWPYSRKEANMSQKCIQEHGTRWVNKWQESKR